MLEYPKSRVKRGRAKRGISSSCSEWPLELPGFASNTRSGTDPPCTFKLPSKILLCPISLLVEGDGEGAGGAQAICCFTQNVEGESAGYEGIVRDQTNMKWASNGQTRTYLETWSTEAACSSAPPEALFEGLNWKGLWNIVVKSSEPFLRDCPANYCAISLWDGELCWTGKWGQERSSL